ncbi:MAG: STAS domain-containing protein [Nitrospirae bacterium]|nr:STAS domain-containing protein [Nitrospirota bacterium]
MLNFNIKQTGDVGLLTLEGDLTVDHAEELKLALLNMMGIADNVVINIENIDAADLTCLQLFCSAHRTFTALKKNMHLLDKQPAVFRRVFEEAGLPRHTGCSLDTQKSCLWKG